MRTTSLIVMRRDVDRLANEILIELAAPFRLAFAGTARTRGCRQSQLANIVGVLFTLTDKYGLCFFQFRQMVGHTPRTVQIPYPSAIAIRSALPKIFRIEAHDLEHQRVVLVHIIVGRYDAT